MLISFKLDLWNITKLLFLLLLCVLILSQSARSPSFDIRLHGSSSIPTASFVERLFIKTFCNHKYLNRRTVYSSGHHGTFNPAVITNKEDIQISEGVIRLKPSTLADNTLRDLHNSSYHTQPRPILKTELLIVQHLVQGSSSKIVGVLAHL